MFKTPKTLKLLVSFILIVVVLSVYGYFKAIPDNKNQTESRPQIEISPDSFSAKGGPLPKADEPLAQAPGWDFGEVKYGEVAEHVFKVKNSGKEVLEIKRLSTSCACTTAEISKEKIAASEEAELLVTYNTGAMSGSHARGEQERIIYIKSNDPLRPQAEVAIRAVVK